MPKIDYHERRAEKRDRYLTLAIKKKNEANQLHDQARKMGEAIPFGQPILVGHHSEQRDRNYREKIYNKTKKAFEVNEISEYYEDKVQAMDHNKAISQDDPEAIIKLKIKLQDIENEIEQVKEHNKKTRNFIYLSAGEFRQGYKKIYNTNGNYKTYAIIDNGVLTWECKKVPENIKEIIENYHKTGQLIQPELKEDQKCYAAYVLENLNGNKNRIKKRIADLEALNKVEAKTEKNDKTGISWEINKDLNRVCVYFPGKPSDEIRSKLKHRGFRWSYTNMAWLAYINNYTIDTAKEIVNGEK